MRWPTAHRPTSGTDHRRQSAPPHGKSMATAMNGTSPQRPTGLLWVPAPTMPQALPRRALHFWAVAPEMQLACRGIEDAVLPRSAKQRASAQGAPRLSKARTSPARQGRTYDSAGAGLPAALRAAGAVRAHASLRPDTPAPSAPAPIGIASGSMLPARAALCLRSALAAALRRLGFGVRVQPLPRVRVAGGCTRRFARRVGGLIRVLVRTPCTLTRPHAVCGRAHHSRHASPCRIASAKRPRSAFAVATNAPITPRREQCAASASPRRKACIHKP
jgi:hypothetical protein